jgi:hypothetical protein
VPLAAAAATLGVDLVQAAGSADPPGIAAWAAIGATICATLPGLCSVFDPTMGTPMASAAGAINPGSGGLVALPGAPLGVALAAAAMSADAAGIQKWTAIGTALVAWMGENAVYGPAGLVGFTGLGTGPVSGVGKVQFLDMNIGPTLAAAAGSTDAEGIARWGAIGGAVLAAVMAYGQIAPTSLQNLAPAGPVTGVGTFS